MAQFDFIPFAQCHFLQLFLVDIFFYLVGIVSSTNMFKIIYLPELILSSTIDLHTNLFLFCY